MTELVVFPDVEAIVQAGTESAMNVLEPGVLVYTAVPNPRPLEFVRILRAGGPSETRVTEAAQVIVEAWAQTEQRAVHILSSCRAYLNAQNGMMFGVYEISGPANLPDIDSDQVRYTQQFGVRVRGAAVTAAI